MSRQRGRELALSDEELVVARSELNALHDDLYVLECAVIDTRRELGNELTKAEAITALRWLLDAASPLVNRKMGTPT